MMQDANGQAKKLGGFPHSAKLPFVIRHGSTLYPHVASGSTWADGSQLLETGGSHRTAETALLVGETIVAWT